MITQATEQHDEQGNLTGYSVVHDDGITLSVPIAQGNRHYQELMTWAEGNTIQPYVEPAKPIPTKVTIRQARLALLAEGLLDQVDAAIASMPSPQKEAAAIEWEYATDVERGSALTQSLAQALGLDEQGLNNLFALASSY